MRPGSPNTPENPGFPVELWVCYWNSITESGSGPQSLDSAVLSGQAVPPHGFGIILRYALAIGVPNPEVELRGGEPLLG